jgi:hypothetical protein
MYANRRIAVAILGCGLISCISFAAIGTGQDKSDDVNRLVQTVRDILGGKHPEVTATAIAPGAMLVKGTRFENLSDVVAGRSRTCSLTEGSYEAVSLQSKTNKSDDAGYLILKTQHIDKNRVRFHTVVFMKDSTGLLKIESWHTGDGGNTQ